MFEFVRDYKRMHLDMIGEEEVNDDLVVVGKIRIMFVVLIHKAFLFFGVIYKERVDLNSHVACCERL